MRRRSFKLMFRDLFEINIRDKEDLRKFALNNIAAVNFMASVGLVILGVGLLILMNLLIGDIRTTYDKLAGTYVMPFNIGFRVSSILGMVAVIAFQMSLFLLVRCNEKWLTPIWGLGLLFDNIAGYRYMSNASRKWIDIALSNSSSNVYKIWRISEIGLFALIVMVFLYFIGRYFKVNNYLLVKRKNNNPTEPENYVIGFIFLLSLAGVIIRYFSNSWYFLICIIGAVFSYLILTEAELTWNINELNTFFYPVKKRENYAPKKIVNLNKYKNNKNTDSFLKKYIDKFINVDSEEDEELEFDQWMDYCSQNGNSSFGLFDELVTKMFVDEEYSEKDNEKDNDSWEQDKEDIMALEFSFTQDVLDSLLAFAYRLEKTNLSEREKKQYLIKMINIYKSQIN